MAAPEKTIAHLANEIIHDSRDLITTEIELLSAELNESLSSMENAAKLWFVGVLFGVLGVIFLGLGSAHLLSSVTHVPLWAAFLIEGMVLAAVSPLFLRKSRISLTPQKTIESVKENIQCIKTQIT